MAYAFPEMVRYNYINCTTCHVSVTGGGVLTPYGRSLSAEALSSFGSENEAQILHGLFGTPGFSEALNLGGDVRDLQMYLENSSIQQAQWIFMQAEIEGALHIGKLTLDSTFGRMVNSDQSNYLGSHQYYALYNFTEEIGGRIGRFYAAYGLNMADHTLYVRQDLGFDQNQETQNLEASYIGDRINAYLSGIMSRGDIQVTQQETAVAGQFSYAILDRYKVGTSIWSGSSQQMKRTMMGLHGILGFTKQLYFLSEIDFQWMTTLATSSENRGFYDFQRFGYEFLKGAHAYLQFQFEQSNLQDSTSIKRAIGGGLLFYPRPHFEFSTEYDKSYVQATGSNLTDIIWLLLHYYL